LSELESRFNLLLTPGEFKDFCPNGLIVKGSSGDPQVTSVVTGVSLRADLINWAVAKGSNVIFVHHPNGFWFSDKEKRVLDTQYGEYMRMLLQNRISLFGFHLPLDAHPTLGNNATVYEKLGLKGTVMQFSDGQYFDNRPNLPDRFMEANIGFGGVGVITDELLHKVFPHGYQAFGFESSKEYAVAICTGSGTSELEEARERGYNMFITGEIRESTPIYSAETGMAVIAAGHHRSEIFGVENIANWLIENGVDARFIDLDNPI
jgi:dinuclear metal center YbgI/SA1388 family protein